MSLSNFRPTPEMAQDIKRELVNAGIDANTIPMDWLEAVTAATFKWVSTRPSGLKEMSNLLGLRWIEGRTDTNYQIMDTRGIPTEDVDPKNIYFVEGCMANDRMHPKNLIRVNEKKKDQCQECGSFVHCIEEVFNHRKDTTDTYCNACLAQAEDLKARDRGDTQMCVACPDITCVHNFIHLRGPQ